MTQCRMCSQRLTRPGKLCRECERELQRARYAGLSIGELVPAPSAADASRMAGAHWIARLRTPGSIIAVAFAMGAAAAVTLHVVENSEAAVTRSVMLDARPQGLRQVSIVSARAASPDASAEAVPVAEAATVNTSSAPATVHASPSPAPSPAHPRAAAPSPSAAVHARDEAPQVAMHVPTARAAVATLDPARELGDALARCGDEPFLARPACQQRARTRYCDGGAPLPQCIVPARDYGQ